MIIEKTVLVSKSSLLNPILNKHFFYVENPDIDLDVIPVQIKYEIEDKYLSIKTTDDGYYWLSNEKDQRLSEGEFKSLIGNLKHNIEDKKLCWVYGQPIWNFKIDQLSLEMILKKYVPELIIEWK